MKPKQKWFAVIGLVWLAGCIAVLGYALYRNTNEKVLNAYALDWTATLITDHLDRNQGAWPRNWEELTATAERLQRESPPDDSGKSAALVSEEISQIRKRVWVKFDADTDQLLKDAGDNDSPAWEVVALKSGRASGYQNRDPNLVILDHLRAKFGHSNR